MLLLATSCRRKPEAGPAPVVVARVGAGTITADELQAHARGQSPFARSQGGASSPAAEKKRILDELVAAEVLVEEARRRGYDRDPQVVRTMKQQMVARLLREEIDGRLTPERVPEAAVERYYKDHAAEFQRPDAVRVSQILIKDPGRAAAVAAQAKASRKTDPVADQRLFRELVVKHTGDDSSRVRGGDVGFVDRNSMVLPRSVLAAALALGEVGQVSDVVRSEQGYHILKLTQTRPGLSRTLPEVKTIIQQRLVHELRRKRLQQLKEELRSKAKVVVDEATLEKASL